MFNRLLLIKKLTQNLIKPLKSFPKPRRFLQKRSLLIKKLTQNLIKPLKSFPKPRRFLQKRSV